MGMGVFPSAAISGGWLPFRDAGISTDIVLGAVAFSWLRLICAETFFIS